jgi:para-aminobenzoate synthetase
MEPGALVPRRAIPTTLVLDFYDSYTRNLLSLFSQLSDLPPRTLEGGKEAAWEGVGWEDRVVIVNVDHLTW